MVAARVMQGRSAGDVVVVAEVAVVETGGVLQVAAVGFCAAGHFVAVEVPDGGGDLFEKLSEQQRLMARLGREVDDELGGDAA